MLLKLNIEMDSAASSHMVMLQKIASVASVDRRSISTSKQPVFPSRVCDS